MTYYNEITQKELTALPTEIGSYKGLSYPRDNSKAQAAGWLLAPIVPFVVPEGYVQIGGTRRIEVTDNVPYELWDTETIAQAESERLAPLIAEYGTTIGQLAALLAFFGLAMPITAEETIAPVTEAIADDARKSAQSQTMMLIYSKLNAVLSDDDIYAIGKAIGVAV